jgi:D-arginine dehydrogenase
MKTCDFLVVGAGIAGASAGYELSAQGRVVVVERENAPGYHTTGRSAAQYVETYGGQTIQRLTKAGRGFFEHPPEGFAEHPLLAPRGAMFVARADQLGRLSAALAAVRALTPSVAEIGVAEAVGLVPVLRDTYLAAAMYEPESMDIDVHALHHGYLRGLARRRGEVLTDAEVVRLSRDGQAWVAETRQGPIAAPVVVNAGGAWCDELAKLAGARPVGLTPKRRTAITFDPPAGVDPRGWPLVIDIDERFYFKPEAGRLLASPADETPVAPCDAQPEELDVAIAVDRVETATTLQVRRITHKWAGLRSFVADKSLVIGMDGAVDGFFWLAGQGGFGIQTAPAAARTAAALITGGRLPDDLTALGVTPAELAPNRLY